MKNIANIVLLFAVSSVLVGCFDISIVNDEPVNKLINDSFKAAQRKVAAEGVVSMPKLPEREFNPYKGGSYTDPLTVPMIFNITDVGKASDIAISYKLDFDPTRPKGYIPEKLEKYPLSSFRMIGVITKLDGGFSALLAKDGENEIITVNEGDYIGMNFGRVIQISEATIKVSEKIAIDRDQTWKEHLSYIDLSIDLKNKK